MITINTDRTVYIPESDRHIGFENDHLVETRYFDITDEDILSFNFKLDLANTKDIVDLEKVTLDDGKCVLVWKITSVAIGEGGVIPAQLRAFDETGEKVWHSHIMEFVADKSVNGEKQIDDERIISEFEQLETRVTNAVREAENMADAASEHQNHAESARDDAKSYSELAKQSEQAAKKSCDRAEGYANNASELADAVISTATRFEEVFGNAGEYAGKAEAHYADKENPHAVTASQVNAYTKEEIDRLLEEKAQSDDFYELSAFSLKDFGYSLDYTDNDYSDFVGDDYISSPFPHVITIHCKGETLGFTASAHYGGNDVSYVKLKVNGEYVIDSRNSMMSFTLQPALMTEDIVAEMSSDTIVFSDMVRKTVKGYCALDKKIGDIEEALDEIIAIQESFITPEVCN